MRPSMPLAPGTRIGPYEVLGPLGSGGMGEVYRARDGRLGRDVAVKTLPASFAGDADRLRRFEQEARSTGVLNHPNILAVHDVGTHEGAPYVVSELLEGESLRDRIGGTALPPRKAIDYATQIARGLAAAHDKGIVHRDLKPENLFLTRDGRVKILDFGLAKLVAPEVHQESETIDKPVVGTDAGQVLGTVGYMSPEQVRARPVDHRSDIFSFGAVLYEMLSGTRAFRGNSAVETMNAILKEDPPALSETTRQLPPALERIVAHCLEKSPEERFQSARDIAFDLEQVSGSSASTAALTARPSLRWLRRALGVLGVAALMAASYRAGGGGAAPKPVVSFRPITFQHGWARDARFGPDGRQIFYQAHWAGSAPDIYVTQAGTPESRALQVGGAGLGGVSRKGDLLIGRLENGALAQVPMGGGAPREILTDARAADWGPDGESIAVIRAAGSGERLEYPIGTPLYETVSMRFPRVAPTGQLVAFSDHPFIGDYRGDIAVVDLAGKKRTLSEKWADIRGLAWSPDGREVWFTATRAGAESSLWAVTLKGALRQVFRAPGSLALQDLSADGRALLFVQRRRPAIFGLAPGDAKARDLSWLDYSIAGTLSRDGKTLLFNEQGEGGGAEYTTYVRSMAGGLPTRLGKGSAADLSRDGRLALVLDMTLPMQVVLLPTGAGAPRPLPRGPLVQIQAAMFLPDGKRIALVANEKDRPSRLYLQDIESGDLRTISGEGVSAPWLSFPSTPDSVLVAAVDAEGRLRFYPTAGGEPRDVPGSRLGDAALGISDDGRHMLVASPGDAGRIFRIDLTRGVREPWLVVAPEGSSPAAFVNNVTLSADGKSYAYTFRDDTSTLYLAEGLR
jgi:eukaryotic-like serine/threonine-protein kinase